MDPGMLGNCNYNEMQQEHIQKGMVQSVKSKDM